MASRGTPDGSLCRQERSRSSQGTPHYLNLNEPQSKSCDNIVCTVQFLSGVGLRPLLVDPEGEARTWLRLASTVLLETVSGGGRELGVVMQQAQRTGASLLVTEADQLDGWWWSAAGAARAVLLTGDIAMAERLEPHIRATLAPLLFTSRLDALLGVTHTKTLKLLI